MSRAIQKARDFTTDFENLFAWYVDQAGAAVRLMHGARNLPRRLRQPAA
jgi:hypothetical protein